jgi:putative membrane protein
MTSKINRNGTAFCRGIVTAGVLATAVALQAQEPATGQSKRDASSTQQSTQHKGRAGDTTTCVTEAAKMNMATIKFGQLASQKAQNAELKRFGQTLETDHKQAQAKLERIAQKHNITLPTALDAKCEEEMSKLQALSGAEFDKEFAKGAVEGHAMAIAHLEQGSKTVKDADLAQYTRESLTQVRSHQQQGRQIAKAVGLDEATIASIESKAKDSVGSAAASETGTSPSSTSPSTGSTSIQQEPSKDSKKQY